MDKSLSKHSAGLIVAILLCMLPACGGHKPPGPSLIPGKISLNPATSASLQLGSIITFTAIAQNASGGNITPALTFQSSNTGILNISPAGVACAGRWDSTFTTCTPGATGTAEVTASALGVTSAPTIVFVHPPIDNITVSEVLNTTPPPPQGPCFSQTQTITLQATAWSQNADVTSTVGPFIWTANNPTVVTLSPMMNSTFNLPTNQATATSATPGLTQIYASASGVSSGPFRQVTPNSSLVWDFFETCPIQSIALQLTSNGEQTGQTSFTANKGTAKSVTAIATDVIGNSSQPNNTGAPVLTKIPLTWSSSRPTAIAASSCTALTCSLTTAGPGSAAVTASCTPPSCNIGFPQVPPGLSSPSCVDFHGNSCQPYIPAPVYASTAISGVIEGSPTATSVIATSVDCAANSLCNTALYNVSTATSLTGNATAIPSPPNSLQFDPAGVKAYMGSEFGAQLITSSNLGSTTNPFSPLGTVTGDILAVSPNGNVAIFSDTVHVPNQVNVTNSTVATNATFTALNITAASAAAFSPDGLKAYIIANGGNSIFAYSSLQALQNLSAAPVNLPPGSGSANLIAFSPNGALVYIAGSPASGPVTGPALTTLSVSTNSVANVIPLPVTPAFLVSIPNPHINGFPDGMQLIALDHTGLDVITTSGGETVQRVELGQGTFNPVAFFVSPDASQLYIVASDRPSILVYNFNTGAVTGIEIAGNATPLVPASPLQPVAGITTDGTLIYLAATDGQLHQISTTSGVDLTQISFPNLPSLPNAFCSLNAPSGQPCKLDLVAVKP